MPINSDLTSRSDEDLAAMISSSSVAPAQKSQALETLHDRLSRLLLAFIAARLPPGRAVSAEDVSQETWIKVLNALSLGMYKPQPGSRFRSWVKAIAHNCMTSELRRKKIQPIGDHEPVADDEDVAGQATDDRRRWLKECLESLDQGWAAIVRLRTSGASHAEISRRLGIEYNTAQTRFHRAKQQLRDCVQQKGQGL